MADDSRKIIISNLATNSDRMARSPLAKVDSVAWFTRKPINVIYAMADGGDIPDGGLQWVWNVATNPTGKKRDLRFLAREFMEPQTVAGFSLEQVITILLGESRREFPAGEVCRLLQVRPITLSNLRKELNGEVRGNGGYYPRAGLVEFFSTRWLGAAMDAQTERPETFVAGIGGNRRSTTGQQNNNSASPPFRN
jgi:hypothetical protein